MLSGEILYTLSPIYLVASPLTYPSYINDRDFRKLNSINFVGKESVFKIFLRNQNDLTVKMPANSVD